MTTPMVSLPNNIKKFDVATAPTAFVSISFNDEDKEVREWFFHIIRSLGIKPYIASEPEPREPHKKIREKIASSNYFIAILTKRTKINGKNLWKPPDWILSEIGMAFQLNKPIGVFIENGVKANGLIPRITDYVKFDREKLLDTMPKIITLLLKMRDPWLSERIKKLINFSQMSGLLALSEIIKKFENIRDLKKLEVNMQKTPINASYILKDGRVLINAGEDKDIKKGMQLEIWKLDEIDQKLEPIESLLGIIEVTHVQLEMSQAIVVHKNHKIWTYMENRLAESSDKSMIALPKNRIKVSIVKELNIPYENIEDIINLLKRTLKLIINRYGLRG